jgi:hypothetical protein
MLKQAAAASLILGFPLLASGARPAGDAARNGARPAPAQERTGPIKGVPHVYRTPASVAPLAPDEVVKRTLARMKAESKPGMVFLYPADAESLAAVTAGLTAMLESEGSAAHVVLAGSVLACLPEREAGRFAGSFAGRKRGCNVLLIDADGRAVDGAAVDFARDDLAARAVALLHGAGNARLRERAAAQRKALGEGVSARIDRGVRELSDASYRVRTAAADQLVELSAGAAAVLAEAAVLADDPEVSGQLRLVLARLARSGDVQARSPVGTVWVTERVDPCPPCGMAVVPQRSRAFLQLICQPDAPPSAPATRS